MVEHVVAVFVLCVLAALGLIVGWWLAVAVGGGLLGALALLGLCWASDRGDAHLRDRGDG
jgi:uncharacterized membrane protein YjdF